LKGNRLGTPGSFLGLLAEREQGEKIHEKKGKKTGNEEKKRKERIRRREEEKKRRRERKERKERKKRKKERKKEKKEKKRKKGRKVSSLHFGCSFSSLRSFLLCSFILLVILYLFEALMRLL